VKITREFAGRWLEAQVQRRSRADPPALGDLWCPLHLPPCYMPQFLTKPFFFVWADCFIRCKVLFFEASPLCHHQEPPNQVFHLEGGSGDKKVCDRPFAPLLCICSSLRAPSPICALLSRANQCQYVGDLSLTQECLVTVIPGGEGPGNGINVWMREVFFCHSIFYICSAQKAAVILDLSKSFSTSSVADTKGCIDLNSSW